MTRYSSEAKQRERETRAQLGPRLPRSPKAERVVTAPPRIPRATGAPGGAISAEDGWKG